VAVLLCEQFTNSFNKIDEGTFADNTVDDFANSSVVLASDMPLEQTMREHVNGQFKCMHNAFARCQTLRQLVEPELWITEMIDPLKLQNAKSFSPENPTFIWYQHLWDNELNKKIRYFLASCACVQVCSAEDKYVIIDINTHTKYFWLYDIVSEQSLQDLSNEYDFIGCNQTLIEQIRTYGYYHAGRHYIHRLLDKTHILLCFKRKKTLSVLLADTKLTN
jgi:hypothetical protein